MKLAVSYLILEINVNFLFSHTVWQAAIIFFRLSKTIIAKYPHLQGPPTVC